MHHAQCLSLFPPLHPQGLPGRAAASRRLLWWAGSEGSHHHHHFWSPSPSFLGASPLEQREHATHTEQQQRGPGRVWLQPAFFTMGTFVYAVGGAGLPCLSFFLWGAGSRRGSPRLPVSLACLPVPTTPGDWHCTTSSPAFSARTSLHLSPAALSPPHAHPPPTSPPLPSPLLPHVQVSPPSSAGSRRNTPRPSSKWWSNALKSSMACPFPST